MCLAVPGKIVSVSSPEEAVADLGGIRKAVNVSLIDDPKPGDWVIIHVGFALQKIDEEQAQETLRALEAAARSGEALQGAGAAA
ncbi:HypC/HybG/HupF family hydrogenase formation chaperone [Mesosutterella sp. OilRF-GAM-744-9]|uniref:HypC/HybG/HupF family hydrogenase formation chaperone n=1 Tax=Mesosutterella porci TaxID=2915351 RepID=A0ABS9MS05_9BURK|nr:HypC/HybG/HupF family hydrogenase formation chaperone [Mesosutterella sp. oilRF-744-WT-GAM-9]MCG5031413.1 HypC/HybG/HupF family hydrogenase formation chaperone [Mesosutterella sp. oilRF-744-WT-GAM-9]MCI6530336.1 HypC/HybG/HupF family hydrogenase formation chaperone [Mesosutterella sp.]